MTGPQLRVRKYDVVVDKSSRQALNFRAVKQLIFTVSPPSQNRWQNRGRKLLDLMDDRLFGDRGP